MPVESRHPQINYKVYPKPCTTVNSDEELEGMVAVAYVAKELDKGTPMDDLVRKFDGDERAVNARVAFLNYHNWMTKGVDGKWHLASEGRCWVKRILGVFYGISPLIFLRQLEEAVREANILLLL